MPQNKAQKHLGAGKRIQSEHQFIDRKEYIQIWEYIAGFMPAN